MDSFRLVIALIGIVLIVGIAGHGIWTIRKNNHQQRERAARLERNRRNDASLSVGSKLDSDGERVTAWQEPTEGSGLSGRMSKSRRRSAPPEQRSLLDDMNDDPNQAVSHMDEESGAASAPGSPLQFEMSIDPEESATEVSSDDHASEQSQATNLRATNLQTSNQQAMAWELEDDEPSMNDSFANEAFDHDAEPHLGANFDPSDEQQPDQAGTADVTADDQSGQAQQQAPATSEPIVDESTAAEGSAANSTSTTPAAPKEPEIQVITLSITGDIRGAILLQILTELGFKYGEMDIFHRHQDSAGHGPVLFSLANMFKPGTFDLENLETFTTEGIVLFLQLPVKGDAHQAFTMMYNAALKISEAMPRAAVLDGNRNPVTKQSVQHAYQRIREFERQQRIYQTANE